MKSEPHIEAGTRRGETKAPPPGFVRSSVELLHNRTVLALLLIVLVLFVGLGIAMVWSVGQTA